MKWLKSHDFQYTLWKHAKLLVAGYYKPYKSQWTEAKLINKLLIPFAHSKHTHTHTQEFKESNPIDQIT